MKLLVLSVLVIVGVSLIGLADVFLKKSTSQNLQFLMVGLVLYALVAFPAALTFRLTEFGLLLMIWEAATILLGLASAFKDIFILVSPVLINFLDQ